MIGVNMVWRASTTNRGIYAIKWTGGWIDGVLNAETGCVGVRERGRVCMYKGVTVTDRRDCEPVGDLRM